MRISYKKLWKLLLDKNLNKTDLRVAVGMSSGTLAKLSKDEAVSMEVLAKICAYLKCNIGDIMEFKNE